MSQSTLIPNLGHAFGKISAFDCWSQYKFENGSANHSGQCTIVFVVTVSIFSLKFKPEGGLPTCRSRRNPSVAASQPWHKASPLLRQSQLFSFPPLINMLKFGG